MTRPADGRRPSPPPMRVLTALLANWASDAREVVGEVVGDVIEEIRYFALELRDAWEERLGEARDRARRDRGDG